MAGRGQLVYGQGPRTRRVYNELRGRIARGEWPPGSRLPPHLDLAAEFAVAPMTVRQVLARLEDEGLVSRQVGRGTFVREPTVPAILLVDTGDSLRGLLANVLADRGRRVVVVAGGAPAGFAALAGDPAIALTLVNLHLPTVGAGTAFVRAVYEQAPAMPVGVIVGAVEELEALFDAPAWPLFVIPTPIRLGYIERLLRTVLPAATDPQA